MSFKIQIDMFLGTIYIQLKIINILFLLFVSLFFLKIEYYWDLLFVQTNTKHYRCVFSSFFLSFLYSTDICLKIYMFKRSLRTVYPLKNTFSPSNYLKLFSYKGVSACTSLCSNTKVIYPTLCLCILQKRYLKAS